MMTPTTTNTTTETIAHLRTLEAIRERVALVDAKAQRNQLEFFNVQCGPPLDAVVDFVVELIRRDYASPSEVPPHSRWRHFDVGGRKRIHEQLLRFWDSPEGMKSLDLNGGNHSDSHPSHHPNPKRRREQTRRLLDLFVVSVLLDAGAGDLWKYHEPSSGKSFARSEGLAVASLDMFLHGSFSSSKLNKHQADAEGLLALTVAHVHQGLQVDDATNPLVGLEGRASLLNRLGSCLKQEPTYFPCKDGNPPRPGNLLDYLLEHPTTTTTTAESGSGEEATIVVQIDTLWKAVMEGFKGVWPATRTKINGESMGDVWPCGVLRQPGATDHDGDDKVNNDNSNSTAHLVPFHKLSQWLTYSLMEPMASLMNIRIAGLAKMTGLPEYRNGGLFVDFGVLTLKEAAKERGLALAANHARSPQARAVPMFEPSDPVVVEWRAMTVALLDKVGERVRGKFGLSQEEMPLVKVLEGGTWKAGREIAAKKRPDTRGPPIQILSDGTVF